MERALLVERVAHEPRQREQRRLAPREREVVEAAHRRPLGRRLPADDDDPHLRLDDDRVALVRDTELKGRDAVLLRDDRVPAEEDARGGAGELGEEEAREHGDHRHAEDRLDGHEQVPREAGRDHLAVADRRHRLHAEEEGVLERPGARVLDGVAQRQVGEGEETVHRHVERSDVRDEPAPRHVQEVVVGVVREASPRIPRRSMLYPPSRRSDRATRALGVAPVVGEAGPAAAAGAVSGALSFMARGRSARSAWRPALPHAAPGRRTRPTRPRGRCPAPKGRRPRPGSGGA